MAKVLIADDDEVCCRSVKTHLQEQEQKHEIYTAQTVDRALDLLERGAPGGSPFEVCIIDLLFDDDPKAGMRVFEKACEIAFLQRIILTAYGSLDNAKRAIPRGLFCYIEKPKGLSLGDSTLEAVADAVRRASAQRELFVSLKAAFDGLQNIISQLGPDKVDPELLALATRFLTMAERSYETIREEAAHVVW
jgi:DNA-binding NtrC family response regulator